MNPVELMGKIGRRFVRYYRHLFCHNNYIFRHDGPFNLSGQLDCTFACYESFENIPEQVKLEMIDIMGSPKCLETDKLELNEHAVLWVGFMEGRPVSRVFTRKGRYFRRWFFNLQPEDTVVFRLNTHPDFRGRGLATSLMSHALRSSLKLPGSAYIDCRTYNKSSIRCIEKAGFKCVAIKKTIKREEALHD